jgi:hypothetical protein
VRNRDASSSAASPESSRGSVGERGAEGGRGANRTCSDAARARAAGTGRSSSDVVREIDGRDGAGDIGDIGESSGVDAADDAERVRLGSRVETKSTGRGSRARRARGAVPASARREPVTGLVGAKEPCTPAALASTRAHAGITRERLRVS